jgi:hypothetical protein
MQFRDPVYLPTLSIAINLAKLPLAVHNMHSVTLFDVRVENFSIEGLLVQFPHFFLQY